LVAYDGRGGWGINCEVYGWTYTIVIDVVYYRKTPHKSEHNYMYIRLSSFTKK